MITGRRGSAEVVSISARKPKAAKRQEERKTERLLDVKQRARSRSKRLQALAEASPRFTPSGRPYPRDTELTEQSHIRESCRREVYRQYKNGVSFHYMGEKIGVAPTTISNFTLGETRYPRFETVIRIARYCGYVMEWVRK